MLPNTSRVENFLKSYMLSQNYLVALLLTGTFILVGIGYFAFCTKRSRLKNRETNMSVKLVVPNSFFGIELLKADLNLQNIFMKVIYKFISYKTCYH